MRAGSDSGKRRPVALVGLMGAGKSTVGRLVATHLGRPFADTDALIEAESGLSIAELFASEGETAFRARERRWIQRIPIHLGGYVLALGGGMFVGEENVARIRALTLTVWLQAQVDTLLDRLGPALASGRPLLGGGGDLRARLTELLTARAPWYARAHVVVPTDGQDPVAVAAAVVAAVADAPPEIERDGGRARA